MLPLKLMPLGFQKERTKAVLGGKFCVVLLSERSRPQDLTLCGVLGGGSGGHEFLEDALFQQ
tara:strand:+ start:418 stop:603 length:186 start_codon:yes stop_codon:yes gene_type:complete